MLGSASMAWCRVSAFVRGNRLRTADRELLEQTIIPYYASQPDINRVLSVGCDWYTRHYHKLFQIQEYWTIDCDPDRARHATEKHVACTLQDAVHHFKPGQFDLIVCNGVYGWGLNTREDCEAGFTACHTLLRPGGFLVFGWNDVPQYRPVPLEDIRSLCQFEPWRFPPLQTARHLTDTPLRHTFDFYTRP